MRNKVEQSDSILSKFKRQSNQEEYRFKMDYMQDNDSPIMINSEDIDLDRNEAD